MKYFWNNFLHLFFPELCKVCKNRLIGDEKHICLSCFYHLPKTNYHLQKDNPVEKRFFGKFDIEYATSYFKYMKDSDYHQLLVELKYRGCKELGEYLGECFAKDLKNSFFINEIDVIVPVPLHPKRLKKRGYNQSEWIAKGLSKVIKKQLIIDNLYRKTANLSQTKKGLFERWKNVSGIFTVKNSEEFEGKHILLVDDVLTTGSTITACAEALSQVNNIKISVVTLAMA